MPNIDSQHLFAGLRGLRGRVSKSLNHESLDAKTSSDAQTAIVQNSSLDEPISAHLDRPASSDQPIEPIVRVQGWAISFQSPLDKIEVYVNDKFAGLARLGIRVLTCGLFAQFRKLSCRDLSFLVDLREFLRQGSREASIVVVICPFEGAGKTLGPRKVRVKLADDGIDTEEDASPARIVPPPAPVSRKRTKTTSSRLPRIACFTHDLGIGGGQLYLYELLRKMRQDNDFSGTVLSAAEGPLRLEFLKLGLTVKTFRMPTLGDKEQYAAGLSWLTNWLLDEEFDFVLANTLYGFFAIKAAANAGLPSAWFIHESISAPSWCALFGGLTPPRLEAFIGNVEDALRENTTLVFEADATRMLFQGYAPTNARTIRYGIDTRKIEEFRDLNRDRERIRCDLGIEESDFVILCIATFEPRKQQTVLALAMSQILRHDPDTSIRLLLVGDSRSEYSDAVRDYVLTAGLEKVVRIVPIVPDPFPYYAAADLVILYSDIESMPRTLLEAMCFARPVLAAAVFGVTELITDGATGFCTEVNSLRSLTEAIEHVSARDQSDLSRIGSAARDEILRTYDSSGYADEIWKLISAGTKSSS